MIGHFNPSVVENTIYEIMEDYETEGIDTYNFGVVDAITDYLTNYAKVEYQACCSEWPNEKGGVCAFSFVDGGHPHLILLDYLY